MDTSGRTRFIVSFFANAARSIVSFFAGVIVARALGAVHFGELAFLLANFTAIRSLTDMGASQAFFTFVAERKRGARFFVYYGAWMLLQFFIPLFLILFVMPDGLVEVVWVGEDRFIAALAFMAAFFNYQGWEMFVQLGEARRMTLLVQSAQLFRSVVHLALIALITLSGLLSVSMVLFLLVLEYAVLMLALAPRLVRENTDAKAVETCPEVLSGFLRYQAPLVVASIVSFAYHFADRWFLQSFGGAAEQGFFAVAQQFSSACLIATGSLLQVLWKEMAEARYNLDIGRMRMLYERLPKAFFL
ncbi:MAG: oligosaccharide flippase family protein [Deltaproteobacteria bacterium]|nr:oligosaccharide flippase family protein [Deltaproteobacteria bacterium]